MNTAEKPDAALREKPANPFARPGAPVRELDVGAALAYTRERERAAPPVLWTPSARMADLLTSGLSGLALARELHRHFPDVTRSEVFMAVGTAVAIFAADLTLAEAELEMLRRPVDPVTS